MKAVIMAGGRGSRLQPLTIGCPKSMVSFGDKPVLEHILNLLKRHHIFEVVITVQYQADQIRTYFGDGSRLGMTVHYAVEDVPLGTAGSIKNAQPFLANETFLVISGDAITDIDLTYLLRFHRKKQALATLALKSVDNPQQYGVVITDDDGCIRQFFEKPVQEQIISNTVNTGIYILEPKVLAMMESNRAYDFSYDIFPVLLKQQALFGCPTDAYWCDIGTIPTYVKAMTDVCSGKINHIFPETTAQGWRLNVVHNLCKYRQKLMTALTKNRQLYPLYWIALSLLVVVSDYSMGPNIQFPFLFIIPVVMAAWYGGKWWGFSLAVILPLIRLSFSTLWEVPWTVLDAGVNAAIRMIVLVLIAFLVDRAARQRRALVQEVQQLRGLLPICSFCKQIRNEDNTWEQLEQYLSRHSEAQFSHGLCPECARAHYPEFFTG